MLDLASACQRYSRVWGRGGEGQDPPPQSQFLLLLYSIIVPTKPKMRGDVYAYSMYALGLIIPSK